MRGKVYQPQVNSVSSYVLLFHFDTSFPFKWEVAGSNNGEMAQCPRLPPEQSERTCHNVTHSKDPHKLFNKSTRASNSFHIFSFEDSFVS